MTNHAIVIKSLADFVQSVQDLTLDRNFNSSQECLWWRGHSSIEYQLLPSIYRGNRDGENVEVGKIHNFLGRAIGRLGGEQKPKTELEWLMLAQHYSLPTPLLDWSESPLVALYFALADSHNKNSHIDSVVYAFLPQISNLKLAERDGLVAIDEPIITGICNKFLGAKISHIVKNWRSIGIIPQSSVTGNPELSDEQIFEVSSSVFALQPYESNTRMVAQLGRFTLHAHNSPLEDLQYAEKFLRKIMIPHELKMELQEYIKWLGIRKWNLFPDLQSLAEGLRQTTMATIPH